MGLESLAAEAAMTPLLEQKLEDENRDMLPFYTTEVSVDFVFVGIVLNL